MQLAGTCICSKVFKYWGGWQQVGRHIYYKQLVTFRQSWTWRWTLCLPTSSNVHLCQSCKNWISQPRGGGIENGRTAAAAATNVLPINHKNGLTFHRLWSYAHTTHEQETRWNRAINWTDFKRREIHLGVSLVVLNIGHRTCSALLTASGRKIHMGLGVKTMTSWPDPNG